MFASSSDWLNSLFFVAAIGQQNSSAFLTRKTIFTQPNKHPEYGILNDLKRKFLSSPEQGVGYQIAEHSRDSCGKHHQGN